MLISEGHAKSFAKAVSWRIVGSLDTFAVALVLTGKPGAASAIASAEVCTKTLLYYLHERAWASVPAWIAAKLRFATAC